MFRSVTRLEALPEALNKSGFALPDLTLLTEGSSTAFVALQAGTSPMQKSDHHTLRERKGQLLKVEPEKMGMKNFEPVRKQGDKRVNGRIPLAGLHDSKAVSQPHINFRTHSAFIPPNTYSGRPT